LNIICSAYWYPEFKGDIHATYVHDINRHLMISDNNIKVIVVTPNFGNSLPKEEMDGVIVERFNHRVPMEFEYGKVAQAKKSLFTKIRGISSMGVYILKNFIYTALLSKKYKADVIHAHWVIPSGFPALVAAKLIGKPCIITMHGGDVYFNEKEGYVYPRLWYIKPFLKYTLRHATLLTAITVDCLRHAINAGARNENIVVVTNGADLRRFSPGNTGGVAAIKKKYSLDGQKMLFTCRQLIPRKGIRYLIKAMPFISQANQAVRLLIAGDGMERNDLETLIDKLGLNGKVFLLGWIPNDHLPHYYNASDIVIMPSLEEGFGIPAAEAMGCERPVVSTDAGGLVEVVQDGVTGIIVPKADEKALSEAVIKLLNDPDMAHRMGKAGREAAEKNFSWDQTAEKFLAHFKNYVESGSVSGLING
jgi:glycosyltransferase involved in cell wall biosynthesis